MKLVVFYFVHKFVWLSFAVSGYRLCTIRRTWWTLRYTYSIWLVNSCIGQPSNKNFFTNFLYPVTSGVSAFLNVKIIVWILYHSKLIQFQIWVIKYNMYLLYASVWNPTIPPVVGHLRSSPVVNLIYIMRDAATSAKKNVVIELHI